MTVSTNPYTSVSITGYNSNPPPDDGTTGADNLLTWDKHKTKLGDPIKTLAESINTNVSNAMAKGINADAGERNQVDGSVAFAWATATIGNSIATPISSAAYLSGATTDTLFELKTGSVYDGAILTLKTLSASDSITLIHATATGAATATAANIYLRNAANRTLDSQYETIELRYDSGVASGWIEDNTTATEASRFTAGTLATASATGMDYGDISSAKRISVMFNKVSSDSNDDIIVQLGDSGGIETTDYVSGSGRYDSTPNVTLSTSTIGLNISLGAAIVDFTGVMELVLMSSDNTWVSKHSGTYATGDQVFNGGGSKTLSGALTQLRITLDGAGNFDTGNVNVQYEI